MTVGGAEDREVPRSHRILVKVPDENAAPEDLNAMAAWEVAKRKADSYQYEATFMGYNDTSGKDIWRLGQVHTVDDDFCGVKGSMMVKEIEFRIDETNGHHTIVNFISADAYTLEVGTPQLPVLQKEGDRVSSQQSATASSDARKAATENEFYGYRETIKAMFDR
jgi:prophage tail gpP-like protein